MSNPLDLDAIREYLTALDLKDAGTWSVFDRRGPVLLIRCLTVIAALREALETSPNTAEHDAGCQQPAHGGPCRCDPESSPRRWAAKRDAALALVRRREG